MSLFSLSEFAHASSVDIIGTARLPIHRNCTAYQRKHFQIKRTHNNVIILLFRSFPVAMTTIWVIFMVFKRNAFLCNGCSLPYDS